MKIYNNLNISKNHKNSVIAIGNFDGIHIGHQKVIAQAKKKAKEKNLKFWSGQRDLNPRPSRWQRDALPLSYARLFLIQ